MSHLDKLTILKAAAKERDWNAAQEALAGLFQNMKVDDIIQLGLLHLSLYLPTFEKYHPKSTWAHRALAAIRSSDLDHSLEKTLRKVSYTSPGSNNFVEGVECLWRAVKIKDDPPQKISLAVDAIANALMASLIEYWYSQHIEDWRRWSNAKTDPETGEYLDQDAPLIPYRFWNDPKVAEYDTSAWLSLANEIEKKITR